MENRIQKLLEQKNEKVLNIYFTAGYPKLEDTVTLAISLEQNGADLIEIGMPYSDPLADGPTIQMSSQKALNNGLTLDHLFRQIREIREKSDIPIILMGYLNQWLQYGKESFCRSCQEAGVDGLIIPDLPMNIYQKEFKQILADHQLTISFLITPQTSNERIRQAANLSTGFLYIVSQSSITGKQGDMSDQQKVYFQRIGKLNLKTPRLIGFGIYNAKTLNTAWENANGAIIGSAFIRALKGPGSISEKVSSFMKKIKQ
jgi:tryptophan synthase alpha chain